MARENRHPERTLARKAKKAKITRERFVELRRATIEKQAKRDNWDRINRAMALTDIEEAAGFVYDGRRPTGLSPKKGEPGYTHYHEAR